MERGERARASGGEDDERGKRARASGDVIFEERSDEKSLTQE